MDLRHIGESDWQYFYDKFPRAYQYLLHASLIGEWQDLLSISPESRNDWQTRRCEELKTLLTVV